jgi:superfamily II DNA or RNA helicase
MINKKCIAKNNMNLRRAEIMRRYEAALGPDKDSRDYQYEALWNLDSFRRDGETRAYVVLATGGGKTEVAVADILSISKDFNHSHSRNPRILWLAHRHELLSQASKSFLSSSNNANDPQKLLMLMESKLRYLSSNVADESHVELSRRIQNENWQNDPIVNNLLLETGLLEDLGFQTDADAREEQLMQEIINEQVLMNVNLPVHNDYEQAMKDNEGFLVSSVMKIFNRLGELNTNQFDYIVVDEAHHAYASTYQSVLNYLTPNFLLGLTATPHRFSDRRHIGAFFHNNLAIDKNLVEMVNEGYLSTMYFYKVNTNIKIQSRSILGDYDTGSLWKQLKDSDRDELIVETYLNLEKLTGDSQRLGKGKLNLAEKITKPALTFAINVDHANDLADMFRKNGVKAEAVTGDLDPAERKRRMQDYERGKIQMLVVVDILNEGYDYPPIEVILMARPTRSKLIYLQQLGRASRLSLATLKESALIIDFVDNAEVLKRPVYHAEIFKSKRGPDDKEKDEKGDVTKRDKSPGIEGVSVTDIEVMDMSEVFGGVMVKEPHESAIYGQNEWLINTFQDPPSIWMYLHKRLSHPRKSNEVAQTWKGIKFFRRLYKGNVYWSYNNNDQEKLFKALKLDHITFEDSPVLSTNNKLIDLVDSKRGLISVFAKELGDPTKGKRLTAIWEGITFRKKEFRGRKIWSFKSTDFKKVKSLVETVEVKRQDVPIHLKSAKFSRLFSSTSKANLTLKEALGEPMSQLKNTKKWNGIPSLEGCIEGSQHGFLNMEIDIKLVKL